MPTSERFIDETPTRLDATALGDAVSDVRASERLTESAVCLVAPEQGYDRQLEKLLQGAGRLDMAARPILEINPAHPVVRRLKAETDDWMDLFGYWAPSVVTDTLEEPDKPAAQADTLEAVLAVRGG